LSYLVKECCPSIGWIGGPGRTPTIANKEERSPTTAEVKTVVAVGWGTIAATRGSTVVATSLGKIHKGEHGEAGKRYIASL